MRPIFEQQYYDAIRSYVPEEAKRVLDEQVPVIRQKVAEEIDAFAAGLTGDIKKVLDETTVEQVKALSEHRGSLTAQMQILAQAGAGNPAIQNAVDSLRESLDAYEEKFKALGSAARKTVNGVAAAYGLPLGFL
ncbi:MAG: hypothetical protein QM760_03590 [Nibricoccus sp.]